jgi:hypothetical protein
VSCHDQLNTTIARVAPRSPSIRPGVAGVGALAGAAGTTAIVSAKAVASRIPALRMVPSTVDVGSPLHRRPPPDP